MQHTLIVSNNLHIFFFVLFCFESDKLLVDLYHKVRGDKHFPFFVVFCFESDNLLIDRDKSGKGFAFFVIFCFDSHEFLVGIYHRVRGGKEFGVQWDFLYGWVSIFFERERERQINNFGDLSVVITEAWLNFCSEEQKKVEPCSSYRIVYSNFVANLYFEVPNTSSKLWFLGRIDFIIFFNFNNIWFDLVVFNSNFLITFELLQ